MHINITITTKMRDGGGVKYFGCKDLTNMFALYHQNLQMLKEKLMGFFKEYK